MSNRVTKSGNVGSGGSGGVSSIIAGTGISVSPSSGLGDVTVTSTGGSQTPWTSDIDGGGFNLSDVGFGTFNETIISNGGFGYQISGPISAALDLENLPGGFDHIKMVDEVNASTIMSFTGDTDDQNIYFFIGDSINGLKTMTFDESGTGLGLFTIGTNNNDPTLSTASSSFTLDNAGSQTIFLFSFSGTPVGGMRGDSYGNFNWHATGTQGHQFYMTLDNSDARTHSIGPDGFLVKNAGATGSVADYAFQARSSGDADMFHADVDGTGFFAGNLKMGAGAIHAYVAKTGTYGIATTDYCINCTANTFTVTLPTAVGVTGQVYVVKNSGAGTITLATTSSQTIDGTTTKTLAQFASYMVMSNGANWIII
jgi:hypothetical protein